MSSKNSHYKNLSEKWTAKHKEVQNTVWTKHKEAFSWLANTLSPKQLIAGSLGGIMLLAQPATVLLPAPHLLLEAQHKMAGELDSNTKLVIDLWNIVPVEMRSFSEEEEQKITETLNHHFGFRVSAELSGIRLNRNYGYIGAEQHLMLYPGDSIYTHFDSDQEANLYASIGMAPGLGAWGYFAQSKEQLTQKDRDKEKYYIAVQTFLSPGFYDNVKKYNEFYKYLKMLVINPHTGRSIITVVGDAGPGQLTGKHLGGSPEVMKYLERQDGNRKGPVLYFFIDDPKDLIPLGPISDTIKL